MRLTSEQRQKVEDNIGLALQTAGRLKSKNPLEFDDLLSVCYLALIKAVQGYDPSKGFAFSTYAVRTMQWYALREANPPKPQIKTLYLEELLPDESNTDWREMIPSNEPSLEDIVTCEVFIEQIREKIIKMPMMPKAKKALEIHFTYPELTQKEVADIAGCSQVMVSRALKLLAERCSKERDDVAM